MRQQEMEAAEGSPAALPRLREALLGAFGRSARSERPAMEGLILGLAGATGPGAERAAEALKRGFRPWRKLLDASPELLAGALRPVEPNLGRAIVRAERLIGVMRRLAARSGGLSLDFLAGMSAEAARDWLEDALALDPPLIAQVLSSSPIRHRVAYPAPAALRVLGRLGLAPPGLDAVKAGAVLAETAPPAWTETELFEFTSLLQALGEGLCADRPDCEACPVAPACPSSTGRPARGPPGGEAARPMTYLRRRIARLEGEGRSAPQAGLRLGGAPFSDAVFPNGLSFGVHQAAAASPLQGAAPLILAVAAVTALERRERDGRAREGPAGFLRRRAKPVPASAAPATVRLLVVQEVDAVAEHGEIYPPGLSAFGVDPSTTAFVSVGSGAEVLRVIEEALKLRAAPVLVAELRRGEGLVDLSVSRRLTLAARRAGAILFLITPDLANTSAALTRWRIGAVPSRASRRRLGPPAFTLDLVRNRLGPIGAWTVEWDLHEQRFRTPEPRFGEPGIARPALPAPHLPPPVDRPVVAEGRAAA